MAWLRADCAFVIVSTVGAPPLGVNVPRCHTRDPCISNTLRKVYTTLQKMSITLQVISNIFKYYTTFTFFAQQLFFFCT